MTLAQPTRCIRVLELSGSSFEMGYAHGAAHRDAIRHFADERVRLSGDPLWTGRTLSRTEVLDLAEACLAEHERYAPDLVEELRGMAAATDLTLAELLIVNGFTDFVDTVHHVGPGTVKPATPVGADNCTAFLVPNRLAQGQGFFGQTWDMHDSATPHVILLRGHPETAPAFLCFTTVGCVGMIGMNEAGVAVGINNLLGADGQIGVTWPFVVRKMLQAETAEAALEALQTAPLAGAHNYLIMDAAGTGYNVEASATVEHVTPLGTEPVIHTNHCLVNTTKHAERPRDAFSLGSSEARAAQAQTLLSRKDVTVGDLQALTRDDTICVRSAAPKHIETCGATIMRPATGDFWMVWGRPAEHPYEHFRL